jgi:N-acetylmuramoyl-L-alanine amidase
MRARILIPLAAVATLIAPTSASAYFAHTITSGESLTSIAAADGLSVAQLAVANGLSPTAFLVSGTTIQIPPQGAGVSAVSSAATPTGESGVDNDAAEGEGAGTATPVSTSIPSGSYVVAPGDTLSAIAARAGVSVAALAAANGLDVNGVLLAGSAIRLSGSSAGSTSVPVSSTSSASGSYLVVPGDTLSSIAARAGSSVAALAAANGLDLNSTLLAGSVIRLSGSTAVPVSTTAGGATAETQPVGATAQGNPTNPPFPTPERLSASQIASVASANGVPGSLADAVAWQESGFNNNLVSSADARGIMQILPGTWDWIQHNLAAGALAPASAADNVRGGVLLLRSLLNSTGGDPSTAAAGYYQGLPSVQQHGLYPDTQQYVQSVLALQRQFGGG